MPPFFDENPLSGLAFQASEAEAELDLRGLAAGQALARIETLLSDVGADRVRTYLLRFDPADGKRGETLFLPVGRRLLEARRAGQLTRCLPLQAGDGYFIELASRQG